MLLRYFLYIISQELKKFNHLVQNDKNFIIDAFLLIAKSIFVRYIVNGRQAAVQL